MNFKFGRITNKNLSSWTDSLRELEAHFSYPLGEDSFNIDHGSNYLAFFERMGNTHFYQSYLGNQIVAVGAGVIHHRLKAWYLCDMKVHPSYRGHKLTLKMFRRYFLPCYLKSQRGFALTMENASGKQNPIMRIMENLPWTPLKSGVRLLFYYENKSETMKAMQVLSPSRPNIHFSSLSGIKDLVLKSTSLPIPLLHMEWNESHPAITYQEPQENFLHMWCLPEGNPLHEKLKNLGILPKASGLIFHHRLGHIDWSDLRTSEL